MFGNRFLKLCIVGLLLAWPAATVDADPINIDWVTVGDPGNTGETQSQGTFGSVGYSYLISKNEVTAGQYRDYLNAVDPNGTNPNGVYNSSMNSSSYGCQITWNAVASTYDFSGCPSGTEANWVDRPVNYVSWYDSLRFCNWLHNGQPTDGSGTEDGAYTIITETYPDGPLITRNPGALFFLPSEDEWYKAAYYKGGSADAGYYLYPTSSGTAPGYVNNAGNLSGTGTAFFDGITDPGNYATYDGDGTPYGIDSPYYRTNVGEWENSASPYGTFDQGGNVWEWNEALVGSSRGLRGGSFNNLIAYWLRASSRNAVAPARESVNIGFRVASIPEPGSITLLVCGAVVLLIWRRRRK